MMLMKTSRLICSAIWSRRPDIHGKAMCTKLLSVCEIPPAKASLFANMQEKQQPHVKLLPRNYSGNLLQRVTAVSFTKGTFPWMVGTPRPVFQVNSMFLAPTQVLPSVNRQNSFKWIPHIQVKARKSGKARDCEKRPPTPENGFVIIIAHFNHCDCLIYCVHRAIRIIIVLSVTISLLSAVLIWDFASMVPLPTRPSHIKWP